MATSCEGFLRKNHAGSVFGKKSQRRYFVTEGFTVFYYVDASRGRVKGHFDLRNVVRIRPSQDPSVSEGAVDVLVAEPGSARPPKMLVISFSLEPARRDAWLKLWCSAIYKDYVVEPLRSFADPALTATLNTDFSDVEAVSTVRSLFNRRAPTTGVLTPRTRANLTKFKAAGAMLAMAARAAKASEAGGASGSAWKPPPPPGKPVGTLPEPLTPLDTPRDMTPRDGAPSSPRPMGSPSERADAPASDQVTFEITVPEGVSPGDRLQATTPSGAKVKLSVPEGAEAGTILTCALSASVGMSEQEKRAAVLIQARARGSVSRRAARVSREGTEGAAEPSAPQTSAEKPGDLPQVTAAATRLQSTFRGTRSRNEQQEGARLQWMRYYMQPEVAEWDEALALAVSAEEEEEIQRANVGSQLEEDKRQKWLGHYLATSNYTKAAELVVSPKEAAQVLKAKAAASFGICACCLGIERESIESERSARFVKAVRDYEWEVRASGPARS
jgi:hypothetical protein